MFNQQQQFHCSTRNNKNISHKKNFTISQSCSTSSECVLYVPPTLQKTSDLLTHKNWKQNISQRSWHSRLAAKYLGAQPKDLLKFSRTSLCNEAIFFKTKDWQSLYYSVPYSVPIVGHHIAHMYHFSGITDIFVYFDFQRNYHDMK